MVAVYNRKCRYLCVPLLFVAIFSCIALIYIERINRRDFNQFTSHATILANDVWALDRAGAEAYLQLAVAANYYKSLAVTLPEDELFQQAVNTPLSGLSDFLYKLGIIRIKNLSTTIMFDNQAIGPLYGEQYVRVIFPLFNNLIFLLFVLITIIFMTHLFIIMRYFEQQVQERTENLRENEKRGQIYFPL